MNLKASDKL